LGKNVTERDALIVMNRVAGLGAITVKKMAERFGSLGAALGMSEGELSGCPGIGAEKARRFCEDFRRLTADEEVERAEKKDVKLVTWVDEGYPEPLKQIADPPLVLYVAGTVEALSRPSVAIVGTRRASVYGRESARRFGYQLASAGYTVVSGLALGIDTEAHTGAVQAKGCTVAVLGGALDCLYPQENKTLARSIMDSGGAVVCDYPFGRQPDAQTFPMRNRIVSGLCKGVLVVESPLKSGTLITVNQALEQGRCVMAVPGRIDSPSSQGTNRLIREGARLVTTADEVIEELQDLMTCARPAVEKKDVEAARPEAPLSPDERVVMAVIEAEAVSIDEVVRGSGFDAGKVNALLVGLQIKRLVRSLPGGRVSRRMSEKD
jgi:DNA processing protein